MKVNGLSGNGKIMALTADCPECEFEIKFEKMPHLRQKSICPECDTELEVAYLYPIMLDWVDEDFLDEDEEEDDD